MGEPIKIYTDTKSMVVYGKAQLDTAVKSGWSLEQPAESIDATAGALSLAEEHGIDLKNVTGSGTNGRITKSDIEAIIN